VTLPRLVELAVSGAGKSGVADFNSSDNFVLNASGASHSIITKMGVKKFTRRFLVLAVRAAV
jgi:hypothetical protein